MLWSSVIYSDGGISGLGSSPGLFVEGTWVWGYFRDGLEKQEPVVLGGMLVSLLSLHILIVVSMTLDGVYNEDALNINELM